MIRFYYPETRRFKNAFIIIIIIFFIIINYNTPTSEPTDEGGRLL